MTMTLQGFAERQGPYDDRLTGLVARLGQARRRTAFAALARVATASLLVAVATYCVLQLAHALLGSAAPWLAFAGMPVPGWLAAWRAAPVPQHLMVAIDVGLLAVAVAQVAAMMRRPGIAKLARAADARFAMDECMSTALEVAETPHRTANNVVAEALLHSAKQRTAGVDAQRLIPIRLPRSAWAVPVLLAIAAIVTVAPPPPLLGQAINYMRAPADRGIFTQEERDATAANLRAIAAVLKQDGDERADARLQAIAEELAALGTRVATDLGLDLETLAADLERMEAMAREAYARAGEAMGAARDLSRLVTEALAAVDKKRREETAKKVLATPQTGKPQQENAPKENPLAGVLTNREEEGIEDYANMNPAGQVIGDPRGNRGAEADGVIDAMGGAAGPDDDDVYGEFGPDGPGGRAGEMVGAADGMGPGDYAGIGTRALYGEGGGFGMRVGLNGEMLLPNGGFGQGRRIRFELPPTAHLTEVNGAAPGEAGGWRAQAEREVTRMQLPAPDRNVVSRYFRALMVERGE